MTRRQARGNIATRATLRAVVRCGHHNIIASSHGDVVGPGQQVLPECLKVIVRDLRNRPCEVSDRVLAGEGMTITREGTPVADLRPLWRGALDA